MLICLFSCYLLGELLVLSVLLVELFFVFTVCFLPRLACFSVEVELVELVVAVEFWALFALAGAPNDRNGTATAVKSADVNSFFINGFSSKWRLGSSFAMFTSPLTVLLCPVSRFGGMA